MPPAARSFPLAATIALIGAVAIGCATSSSQTSTSATNAAPAPSSAARRGDRTRLDSADLRGHNYRNLYDAINVTHAEWFRAMGGTNTLGGNGNGVAPVVGVFVEGSQRSMGIDYLKSLDVEEVRQVRHLTGSESLINYGPEWGFGAIVITLRS